MLIKNDTLQQSPKQFKWLWPVTQQFFKSFVLSRTPG